MDEGSVVNVDPESNRARRYLLGEMSEDERAAVEREYFGDERSLERMEVAEENLIEDYLSDRLGPDDRRRFHREYLAVPHRRRRVETIQALMSAARRAAPSGTERRLGSQVWASLAAAALVALVLGGWWMLRTRPAPPDTPDPRAATPSISEPPVVTVPAPRIFAVSVSPMSVRSAGPTASLVIPSETDVVRVHLEGEAGTERIEGARARVRTVTGAEVWRGSAQISSDAPGGTVAQIDVPAARLPADDYVIELFGRDAAGAERERARYFLAVRAR